MTINEWHESDIRFWSRVERRGPDDCWMWKAGRMNAGYGAFYDEGKQVLAHRYSYQRHHGPIGVGLDVCHKCDVRACVNPAHLFAGTRAENIQDAAMKGRMPKGERHASSKISDDIVGQIRNERMSLKLKLKDIAHRYGISESYVCQISKNIYRRSA